MHSVRHPAAIIYFKSKPRFILTIYKALPVTISLTTDVLHTSTNCPGWKSKIVMMHIVYALHLVCHAVSIQNRNVKMRNI